MDRKIEYKQDNSVKNEYLRSVDDDVYVVEAVSESKKKKNYVVTAYKSKEKQLSNP